MFCNISAASQITKTKEVTDFRIQVKDLFLLIICIWKTWVCVLAVSLLAQHTQCPGLSPQHCNQGMVAVTLGLER